MDINCQRDEEGFKVGEAKDAAGKCRQKFANLLRAYIAYMRKADQTGVGFVERPQYFVQMNAILGDKHKVTVPYLMDTLESSPATPPIEDLTPAAGAATADVVSAGPSSAEPSMVS